MKEIRKTSQFKKDYKRFDRQIHIKHLSDKELI